MENNQKALLIGLTVFIFGFLVIGNTVQLPYSAQVTKMVREPYEDKECKQVPYQVTDEVALTYKVLDHGQTGGMSGFLNYVTNGWVQIENTDDKSGTFKVSCKFQTLDGTFSDSDSVFINPGQSGTANCQADTSLGQDSKFSYTITPGTKTVIKTEYREECEWVTKYHDVEREVTETRYHTVFQSWFGD
ncbi:MAG: hypothetical protein COS47_00615 [Candidatus Nealsonbacteria bacterium CG03_land_8_20_14_0_80_36_12]|uniref:Uncharacterized protein n=1 Tax=Candidatus Nealsonbacteria bacterium CG03_land_8_20_14_0_80_36_12 TaxID=1974701 RepID=A0A2M7BYQ0_9BACT|nr:MAG: hypothetical protein COS47_00615 [Candidatus Nealsonbacteria bacterium CG03_land_8_20_14_0_80_36_12]